MYRKVADGTYTQFTVSASPDQRKETSLEGSSQRGF